ncbi:MAG: hypothetical protein RIT27_1150 [Pseudomonadota bacterium]|jgi:uncharacterized ferritin-like protein (DUF455 family)
MTANFFETAYNCLINNDINQKICLTRAAEQQWKARQFNMSDCTPPQPILSAGRPEKPLLVAPKQLISRKLTTKEGHAALIHAVVHIEFNAINLAWDAAYRFRGLPIDFYGDWLQVAVEEALHFELLRGHLQSLGFDYGDFPAHNGLWELAVDTADDVLARMALVPRVMEARGLDVTPPMINKLKQINDINAVEILNIIYRDEIGHVARGSKWFHYVCEQRHLNPQTTFLDLIHKHLKSGLKLPFNQEVRLQAGFTTEELAFLCTALI